MNKQPFEIWGKKASAATAGLSLVGTVTSAWLSIRQNNKRSLHVAAYIAVTAVSLFLGFFWVSITPVSYQARAVLGAVEGNGNRGTIGGIGQISQALGVSLSANNLSQGFGRFQELLASAYLVRLVDEKYRVADMLSVPPDGAVSSSLRLRGTRAIKDMLGVPTAPLSRFEQLRNSIRGALGITPVLQTQTIEVTFNAVTPDLAKRLLSILIDEADGVLKQRAAARAGKEVGYLMRQLSTVNGQVLREALYPSVVEGETRLLMASSDLPYSVETLDEPFASSQPDWPRPTWQIGVVFVIFQVFYLAMRGYRYLLPEQSVFRDEKSRMEMS